MDGGQATISRSCSMWHCSRWASAAAESAVYLLNPVNHAWAAESASHLLCRRVYLIGSQIWHLRRTRLIDFISRHDQK